MAKKDLFKADTIIGNEGDDFEIRKKASIRAGAVPQLVYGGRSKPLSNKVFGIGRDRSNAVIVSDPKVSKFHAMVTFVKGEAYVRDSGSSNGTYLNGKMVPQGKRVRLKAGDTIRIGDTEIAYT